MSSPALYFDGVSDYVDISGFSMDTSSYAVSMWVKFEDYGNNRQELILLVIQLRK